MQALFLAALLSSPALALVVSNTEAEEKAPSKPGNCVSSTRRWTKRNSSGLFETPKKVKKIYFINVESNKDRKSHMEAELKEKAKNIPVERFKAFNKNDVPGPKHPTFKLYSKGRYTPWLDKDGNKKVYAAIHFSNYQVLEHILKQDPKGADSDEVYLVTEDDTQFMPGWEKKLESVLAHTPKEWQMIRIGYWGQVRCEDKENEFVFALQAPSVDKAKLGGAHFYSGNTAYVVRPKSIPHILDVMRNSSVASIENVFQYPHKMADGSDQQVLSYAVSPQYMLVTPTSGFQSSH